MAEEILTQEYLQKVFDYKDGNLFWKIRKSNCIQIGDKAGCIDTNGYSKVRINKKMIGTHRLIFMFHYGFMPFYVDHIDRDVKNNKIENLREATNSQNQWNTIKNIRNTSGYKNVLFRKDRNKWTCRFKVNGKNIMRGSFDTPEEASIYAEKLRIQFHKEFANS